VNHALAIFVGLIFTIGLTTLADQFLSAPASDIEWMIHLVYRVLFNLSGCALAARLGVGRASRAALVLGALLTGFAATWLLQSWQDEAVPRWHPTLLVLLTLPAAWLGGQLGRRSGAAS
jgi:hypothetical protein